MPADFKANKIEFEKIVETVKKELNWEIQVECPKCKRKLHEDAFQAIRIWGMVDYWWCPECMLENDGEVITLKRSWWHTNGSYVPNHLEILEEYQKFYLQGYLTASYNFENDERIQEFSLLSDLSMAVIRIYIALEIFLSYRIKQKLLEKNIPNEFIETFLKETKPDVKVSIVLLKSLGVQMEQKMTDPLMAHQKIRNNIIHRGTAPKIEEFFRIFTDVSKVFALK